MRQQILFSGLVLALLLLLALPAFAWEPPIGIPRPEFGIEETLESVYGSQDYYTHYVECIDPNNDRVCDNSCSDSYEFGSPEQPRCSLPRTIPAGSVVEVHGGPYSREVRFLSVQGTADRPVFIRGLGQDDMPLIAGPLYFYSGNASYVILENLEFTGGGKVTLYAPSDHVVLRNSHAHDLGGGFMSVQSPRDPSRPNEFVTDTVIYNNLIHDLGDWQGLVQKDWAGIFVSRNALRTWVVDNEVYHCQGDSIIVTGDRGGDGFFPPTLTYIGRNKLYENNENSIDLKVSFDNIISENEMYGMHKPCEECSFAGDSPIIVAHCGEQPMDNYDCPERNWYLFNKVYDADVGFTLEAKYDNIIGNEFYNINCQYYINDETAYVCGAAIKVLYSSPETNIVNNYFYNVDLGLAGVQGSDAITNIQNNIIDKLSGQYEMHSDDGARGYHIYWERLSPESVVNNNIFYDEEKPIRVRWGSNRYEIAIGDADEFGNLNTNPLSAGAAAMDFSLSEGSPGINSGVLNNAYQTFFDGTGIDGFEGYGIDIKKDIEGNTRPVGDWDMGAHEFQGPECVDMPALLNYISQWRQGSITMPSIISKLARWKSGEGC